MGGRRALGRGGLLRRGSEGISLWEFDLRVEASSGGGGGERKRGEREVGCGRLTIGAYSSILPRNSRKLTSLRRGMRASSSPRSRASCRISGSFFRVLSEDEGSAAMGAEEESGGWLVMSTSRSTSREASRSSV